MSTPPDRANLSMRTRLSGAGRNPPEQFGFVNTPVYRGSTVLYPSYADLKARAGRYTYGTHGTPTTLRSLETSLVGAVPEPKTPC